VDLRYLSTAQLWYCYFKLFLVCALLKIATAVSIDLCYKKAHLYHIDNSF
jgi:hypothetical protein